jgi:hypothetical protein
MSYDLTLWKQKRGCKKSALAIYNQLCEGEDVTELVGLPVEKLLERIKAAFPGAEENAVELDWEDPKGKAGAVQVSWSKKHVRFDCYGLSVKYMKLIMAVARDFGLPVWDPQREVRYETDETGREKPPTD